MAQLSKTAFDIQTAVLFPTNGVGAISALDLRTQINNLADSVPFKSTGRTGAPGVNDDGDNTGGNGAVEVGDIWVNETANQAYICLDNTATAAIWTSITGGGGGGVGDGTYGDITVTDAGLVWTINDGAVSLSKLQDITNNTVLGRMSETDGPVMELDSAALVSLIGLVDIAVTGSASDLVSGTVPVARLSATKSELNGIVSDDDVAFINTAQNFTKAQGSTPVALVDGANIATDASLSNVFTVTLGGNRTLDNPTNLVAGRTYAWIITQDGSGGHTLAYGSNFDFPGGTAPTVAAGAGDVSLITGIAISTSRLLCAASLDFS